MNVNDYIDRLNTRFRTGISREHSYRGDLQTLLENIAPEVLVTNEPARISCGAPDYIITRQNIPVGYIEAKDIGADLKSKAYKAQFDRYRRSLTNLIITDYLDFRLFRDGEFVTALSIGQIQKNRIIGKAENYSGFTNLIKDFCAHVGQTVTSASELSKMMAGKARLLADVIEKALLTESQTDEQNNTLHDQLKSFQEILIHDITEKEFADIYAQTIAYGMFAARLHDHGTESFSRQAAAELIPKSNPFLRKLFQYIAGYDLDDRIRWIVDALADIFRATSLKDLRGLRNPAGLSDPVIHFYETFLSEYDPALRKSRGVWYTPEPVVNFIVRAVDDILKTEFGLARGLADTAKTKIKVEVQGKKTEQEVHKVQILDPAAGTGTFLAHVVKHIYRQFEGQQGIWSSYVDEHLIPRLNGFEILMASYAMAHLKLDLLLSETGYDPKKPQRFRVFLTNSLEEHHPDTGTLFASWLSAEANEANYIKRDTPVMVVLGNPPYSGESANKGEWIMKLMADYKKEPGGKEKLKERNPKWINDDYVKFIRYGQYFIEKNGSGVLAFINPHGFLDNPTFRGMRWNLLKTFDKIYTIDLHGNSKKKEICPDGSKDENVFDIMQGVSVNLFVKTGKKKANELGKVFHFDLYGKRELKYDFLSENSLKTISYKEIPNKPPMYFMVRKNFETEDEYEKGFLVTELFPLNGVGICSKRDKIAMQFEKKVLLNILYDFENLTEDEIKKKYHITSESRDQKVSYAKQNILEKGIADAYIKKISYRIFDNRWTYHTNISKGFLAYPVYNVMKHFHHEDNLGLITNREQKIGNFDSLFVTGNIIDLHIIDNGSYLFPLYLCSENGEQSLIDGNQGLYRVPNLNMEIVRQFAEKLKLTFMPEKGNFENTFAPIDLLDYIYAVLYSPNYREKYKEFLKIDFPGVPFPKDTKIFWQLVRLGGELRQIHLLESPVVEKPITTYPQSGENIVVKSRFENNKVWINEEQYFDNVPQIAWEFYIGGYQPAQKWLKDRKGRKLDFDDILHYQKIIAALSETDRIMKQIDDIDFM